VVHDVVDDDLDAPGVGGGQEGLEVVHGAVVGIDTAVINRVVAVVAGRVVDGHEPDAGDAQVVAGGRIAVVQVVELRGESRQIADAVAVAVAEAAHEDLVEHGVVPPAQLALFHLSAAGFVIVVPDVDEVLAALNRVGAVVAHAGKFLGAVPLAVDAELELDVLALGEAVQGDGVNRVAFGIVQRRQLAAPAVETARQVHRVHGGLEQTHEDLLLHAHLEGDVFSQGGGDEEYRSQQ
jgi:hypothetical protein